MAPRLASNLLVNGLIRLAEAQGGTGVVVAKGDAQAGAVALILSEKGKNECLLERVLQPDGRYAWARSQNTENEADFQAALDRKKRFDPDLWIVELDIASAERFADEMNDYG